MKCLVSGGAGFIGSHLVEELVRLGHAVTVLDDFSTGRRENLRYFKKKITCITADIADAKAVNLAARKIDRIFHLAAIASVPQSISNPQRTYAVNVLGTLNIFKAAADHRVRSVVYASSCAVYGDQKELPYKEDSATRPISFYGQSKLENESLADLFFRRSGLNAVGLRFFNVFGPRQNAGSAYAAVVPIFLEKFEKHQPPVIFGDGKQTRDFIYVKDVVKANLLAANSVRLGGKVLNVGTGHAISLNRLVEVLNGIYGLRLKPRYQKARAGDIRHSVADTRQAARLASFRSKVSLLDALRLMKTERKKIHAN